MGNRRSRRAFCVLWVFVSSCTSHSSSTGTDAATLIDNPVDEYGFSIVGEDVFPPLYQRVEAKCVETLPWPDSECESDEQCGAGYACICGELQGWSGGSVCVRAECRTTADCNGGRCLVNLGTTPVGGDDPLSLVCSREGSTCRDGGDCPGNGQACVYDKANDRFECKIR